MTECNRCGKCCDPVEIGKNMKLLLDMTRQFPGEANEHNLKTQQFADEHWTLIDQTDSTYYYECAMFNKETRLCMAHDLRPPVCSGYPFYDREPDEHDANHLPQGCSFWQDVPGWTPSADTYILPIVEIK